MYLESSQIFLSIVVACGLVVIIVVLFLYSNAQHYQKYFRLRQASVHEGIRQVEQERGRISLDLHDNICMRLHTEVLNLDTIEPNQVQHQELLTQSKTRITMITEELRQLSYLLLPAGLAIKGPLVALEDLVDSLPAKLPMSIEVNDDDGSCSRLTEEQSLHLYRMLQEILQNTLKHSKAKKFLVSSRRKGNTLMIHTYDDGIGFNPEQVKNRPSAGLYNLQTRAQMIGADIETHSEPGKGTRYEIRLNA